MQMTNHRPAPIARGRRTLIGLVLATGIAVLVPATPASASSANFYLEAADERGVHADSYGTFRSPTEADVDLVLTDRSCDASSVYGYFIAYTKSGARLESRRFTHNGGCGSHAYWPGLRLSTPSGISRLQLRACVDSAGTDECDSSATAYNPYSYGGRLAYVAPPDVEGPVGGLPVIVVVEPTLVAGTTRAE